MLGKAASYLEKTLSEQTFPLYLEEIQEQAERAWVKYKMVLIPGVEFTKNSFAHKDSAHFLGLGISEFIDPDQDVVDITRQIREQGGIAIAAHPVSTRRFEPQTYYLWHNRHELQPEFDAWEVASGPHLFDEVIESRMPFIANSDLHHPLQVDSWKTVVHAPRHPGAILQAIKQQRVDVRFYKDAKL